MCWLTLIVTLVIKCRHPDCKILAMTEEDWKVLTSKTDNHKLLGLTEPDAYAEQLKAQSKHDGDTHCFMFCGPQPVKLLDEALA